MTRSIFDPTGNPERSGSTFTPPDADEYSNVPDEIANAASDAPTEPADSETPESEDKPQPEDDRLPD